MKLGLLPILLAGIMFFMAIGHHGTVKKYIAGEESSYELSIDADDNESYSSFIASTTLHTYGSFFHVADGICLNLDKAFISLNSVRVLPWNRLYILYRQLKAHIA